MYRWTKVALPILALFIASAFVALPAPAPAQAQTCVPMPSGGVDYWPFDGNTDNLVDPSGDATLENTVTFVAGKVGQAVRFDGTNSGAFPNTNFADMDTVEFWFSTSTFDQTILSGGPTFSTYSIGINSVGEVEYSRFRNVVGGYIFLNGPFAADGLFHHVAAVTDQENHKLELYFDKVLVDSYIELDTLFISDGSWAFAAEAEATLGKGDTQGLPELFFNGPVDELSVYNRPLPTAEIAAIFDAGSAGKCKNSFVTATADIVLNEAVSVINIDADGVHVDCNFHDVGGFTRGIYSDKDNVRFENCNIVDVLDGVEVLGDSASGLDITCTNVETCFEANGATNTVATGIDCTNVETCFEANGATNTVVTESACSEDVAKCVVVTDSSVGTISELTCLASSCVEVVNSNSFEIKDSEFLGTGSGDTGVIVKESSGTTITGSTFENLETAVDIGGGSLQTVVKDDAFLGNEEAISVGVTTLMAREVIFNPNTYRFNGCNLCLNVGG